MSRRDLIGNIPETKPHFHNNEAVISNGDIDSEGEGGNIVNTGSDYPRSPASPPPCQVLPQCNEQTPKKAFKSPFEKKNKKTNSRWNRCKIIEN